MQTSPRDFQELARISGGRTVNLFARDQGVGSGYPSYQSWGGGIDEAHRAAVAVALRQLYGQMRESYVAELEFPPTIAQSTKQRSWKLEAVEGTGRRKDDYFLQYPTKVLSCGAMNR